MKKEEDAEEEERRVRYFDRGLNNCERDLQKKKIFDKRDVDWKDSSPGGCHGGARGEEAGRPWRGHCHRRGGGFR